MGNGVVCYRIGFVRRLLLPFGSDGLMRKTEMLSMLSLVIGESVYHFDFPFFAIPSVPILCFKRAVRSPLPFQKLILLDRSYSEKLQSPENFASIK